MNYLTYEDVAGRRSMFKYVIENDLMPPWPVDPNLEPLKNDLSLSVKEKYILLRWVDEGYVKGKKSGSLGSKNKEEVNSLDVLRKPTPVDGIVNMSEVTSEKFVNSNGGPRSSTQDINSLASKKRSQTEFKIKKPDYVIKVPRQEIKAMGPMVYKRITIGTRFFGR